MKHVTKLVKCKLVGTDGNAFALLGTWKTAARKQGTPKDEIDAVMKDAMSGNYDNLLQVLIANIA